MPDSDADYEIIETDFGDGDVAFSVELSIPPFGTTVFASDDLEPASLEALTAVCAAWPQLWPEILERLETGIVDYGLKRRLDLVEFTGLVAPMEEGFDLSDKADIYLSLQFDEDPQWDFYLRGPKIVHSQAVFPDPEE